MLQFFHLITFLKIKQMKNCLLFFSSSFSSSFSFFWANSLAVRSAPTPWLESMLSAALSSGKCLWESASTGCCCGLGRLVYTSRWASKPVLVLAGSGLSSISLVFLPIGKTSDQTSGLPKKGNNCAEGFIWWTIAKTW